MNWIEPQISYRYRPLENSGEFFMKMFSGIPDHFPIELAPSPISGFFGVRTFCKFQSASLCEGPSGFLLGPTLRSSMDRRRKPSTSFMAVLLTAYCGQFLTVKRTLIEFIRSNWPNRTFNIDPLELSPSQWLTRYDPWHCTIRRLDDAIERFSVYLFD